MSSIKQLITRQPWLLALGAFALVGFWMASGMFSTPAEYGTESGDSLGITEGPTRVQVAARQSQIIDRKISIYGGSSPARSVTLGTETDGRVEQILARRGQPLKAGDPILKLDLRDRQAKIDQSKASVREHKTRYEAQQQLQKDGYVSDSQMAETLAKLESARAELTRAELDLKNMTIRAPFDGILEDRDVEIGDYVRSGDQIGSFVDNTKIIITASLAEQDAVNVKAGDTAEAKLVTGQQVSGKIRYVSPVANRETRTFTAELEIPNPDGSLPAGVTAEMFVSTGKVQAHKMSPALLSLASDGTLGVNIVDEFDRVQFYPVEIVQSGSDGIWVSGLPDIAQVVMVGQGYVSQGQLVDPVAVSEDTALAAEETEELEQLN